MRMQSMATIFGTDLLLGLTVSCMSTGTGSGTKVQRIQAAEVQDLSGYWNDKDVQPLLISV